MFDDNMIALAEAALDDKAAFSHVVFEIRSEYGCTLMEAGQYTEACLSSLAQKGNVLASEAMARWRSFRRDSAI